MVSLSLSSQRRQRSRSRAGYARAPPPPPRLGLSRWGRRAARRALDVSKEGVMGVVMSWVSRARAVCGDRGRLQPDTKGREGAMVGWGVGARLFELGVRERAEKGSDGRFNRRRRRWRWRRERARAAGFGQRRRELTQIYEQDENAYSTTCTYSSPARSSGLGNLPGRLTLSGQFCVSKQTPPQRR